MSESATNTTSATPADRAAIVLGAAAGTTTTRSLRP
jgi:hypothetical protein